VPPLPPDTAIGAVSLTVRDLDRSLEFYERTIGLRLLARDGATARLGAGDAPLVELVGEPEAPPRPRRSTGLFHFAILVPSREELARSLARLAERRWPLSGASDHLVSEALYLNDPDGIGIEIYRDRPREKWPRQDGTIQMATLPLDLQSVLDELPRGRAPAGPPGRSEEAGSGGGGGRIAEGTRIGHVHLNVADLADAERFWCGEIGFEVTVRTYPGALFVSAGGYHHHLGLNTWNGVGAPPPPEGAIGLRHFEVLVPGLAEPAEATDPSGNRVHLHPGRDSSP